MNSMEERKPKRYFNNENCCRVREENGVLTDLMEKRYDLCFVFSIFSFCERLLVFIIVRFVGASSSRKSFLSLQDENYFIQL